LAIWKGSSKSSSGVNGERTAHNTEKGGSQKITIEPCTAEHRATQPALYYTPNFPAQQQKIDDVILYIPVCVCVCVQENGRKPLIKKFSASYNDEQEEKNIFLRYNNKATYFSCKNCFFFFPFFYFTGAITYQSVDGWHFSLSLTDALGLDR
jgi:hypothetical protein